MGGREMVSEIHRTHPEAKVIASSGYSNDTVMADFERFGFCGAVAKPYRLQELLDIVAQVMGG